MNKSLFILLSTLTIISCNAGYPGYKDELRDKERPSLYAKSTLGIQGMVHTKDGSFVVVKNGKAHPVATHLVAKNLRNRTNEQMARYLSEHQVRINQVGENEFAIQEGTRALGAGLNGAWWGATIGKGVGYGIGAGLCYVAGGAVTIIAGPIAGAAAAEGIKAAALPTIESFSNICAIGGGMIGAVITGPV